MKCNIEVILIKPFNSLYRFRRRRQSWRLLFGEVRPDKCDTEVLIYLFSEIKHNNCRYACNHSGNLFSCYFFFQKKHGDEQRRQYYADIPSFLEKTALAVEQETEAALNSRLCQILGFRPVHTYRICYITSNNPW